MGRKWGSNEDIHIGDIFMCWHDPSSRRDYYQVVALRGRTQVVLRAIHSETYINEGIAEDSPLFWHRERTRPLPGQFIDETEEWPVRSLWKGDKEILDNWHTVTARVLPCRMSGDRPALREISEFSRRLGWITYSLEQSEDCEPWNAEAIQKLEEYRRQEDEVLVRHWKGEKDVTWPEYPI